MREQTLTTLIELSQERFEQAGKTLSELNHQRQQAQEQLNALDSYLNDYKSRLQNDSRQGIAVANYHNFRRFIANLDDAICQQNRIIAQIDTRLDAGRAHWREERRQLKAYEALQNRHAHQQRHLEQRRDQLVSDELSARLAGRSRAFR